ncbi:MAG: MFS transporter [Desulfotomaculaceae bacterium]|nr:MFS transporter [Desulfotomaculaceae bacterium]
MAISNEEQQRYWFLFGLINFLLGFAVQSSIIFIPLLGAQLGASDFQVGLVGTVYGAAFLLSSLISGWKSDSLGRLLFVRWGLLLSSLAFALQLLAQNVILLMVFRSMVGLALGIATAAIIAYAFESGIDMGKFSSYGSLGWIFSALAAALVKNIDTLFLFSFLSSLIAFFFSLAFRKAPEPELPEQPNPWQVARRNHRVYLAVFLRHLGATAVWIIMPLYLVELGLDEFWIGIMWGINFTVQAVVMRCLERFPEHKTFAIGQLMSILVFILFAYARGRFSLVAAQALLGVAWSCLYVGALLIIMRSGEARGTASGIFQSTLNLCNAIGPFLGGVIAQGWGYRGVMFFAAALGVAGMLAAAPKSQAPVSSNSK